MASAQEIASWVVESFDPKDTCTVERVVEKVLCTHGTSVFDAPEEAERKAGAVLGVLQKMQREELPFDISDRDGRRLVGKQRLLTNDTQETKELKARLNLIAEMRVEIPKLGHQAFEKVCAGLMRLSGAKDAFAQCANDDGGIDVYGRLPIRLSDPKVSGGLLRSIILEKSVLFLGQCKCQSGDIGPGEINDFHGAAADCLRQYEGNLNPPSHRVPASYYRRQEMCICVFFTTADYTEKAVTKATSLDITLVNGRQIAEFLVYHKIGITYLDAASTYLIEPPALSDWLATMPATP